MALTLYHAEPLANSAKSLIPLHEKGLAFESRYVDLGKFEQHEPWFLELNPEGQVPVLVHDGAIVRHTTVINEYLEDAFPDTPPLRPVDALGKARMRDWNKFVDEQVMNFVSIHGWNRRVALLARQFEEAEFDRYVARIPLLEQREKWKTARAGFDPKDLANAERKVRIAVDKAESQLGETPWLAGDMFTLADINFFSHCAMMLTRLFPEIGKPELYPRLYAWADRIRARPGVAAALAGPDHTDPAIKAAIEKPRA